MHSSRSLRAIPFYTRTMVEGRDYTDVKSSGKWTSVESQKRVKVRALVINHWLQVKFMVRTNKAGWTPQFYKRPKRYLIPAPKPSHQNANQKCKKHVVLNHTKDKMKTQRRRNS